MQVTASRKLLLFGVFLALALFVSRFVELGGDLPPSHLPTESAALWADEGYKTLSPRNLAEYGVTHWNAADAYSGWMAKSPITQNAFRLSFEMFGIGIVQARLVSLLCLSILLGAFFVTFRRIYDPVLLVGGLILFTANHLLLVFSRTAIFEIFLALAVCLALFAVRRWASRPGLGSLSVLGAVAAIAVLGIKLSALLYFAPALVAVATAWLAGRGGRVSRRMVAGFAVLLVAAAATAFLTSRVWTSRLNWAPEALKTNLLEPPLIVGGALVLIAAAWCAGHLLIRRPANVVASSYLSALIGTVLLGALAIGQFEYSPLRYWIPLLPACILLLLEWFHVIRDGGNRDVSTLGPVTRAVMTALGTGALTAASVWLAMAVMRGWIIGLSQPPFMIERRFILIGAAAIVGIVGWWRLRLLSVRATFAVVIVLIVVNVFADMARTVRLLSHVRHDRATIAMKISRNLAPGESVAGDWAPMLTLGSGVRALYLGGAGNDPGTIAELRPDAFLDAGGSFDAQTRDTLRHRADVHLDAGRPLGRYAERDVMLYRLRYR